MCLIRLNVWWGGFEAAATGWNGADGLLWSEYPLLGFPAVPWGVIVNFV